MSLKFLFIAYLNISKTKVRYIIMKNYDCIEITSINYLQEMHAITAR